MHWTLAIWPFVLGACVGSFLNVLVCRLPVGRSLLHGSSCGACQAPVRWCDNVPILSWFYLRGRCRHCRAPFSWRYPAMEAAVAAAFTALAAVQWSAFQRDTVTASTAALRFALQATAFCLLLSIGLICRDRQKRGG